MGVKWTFQNLNDPSIGYPISFNPLKISSLGKITGPEALFNWILFLMDASVTEYSMVSIVSLNYVVPSSRVEASVVCQNCLTIES